MGKTLVSCVALLLLAGCAGTRTAGSAHPPPPRYSAVLHPLSGSHVTGRATLSLAGDQLTVSIAAAGLQPQWIHEQGLYGFEGGGRAAACPKSLGGTPPNATETAAYGTSVLKLEPFPTVGPSGDLRYSLTFNVDGKRLAPLAGRVIVLRGMNANVGPAGALAYDRMLPVACGKLTGHLQ